MGQPLRLAACLLLAQQAYLISQYPDLGCEFEDRVTVGLVGLLQQRSQVCRQPAKKPIPTSISAIAIARPLAVTGVMSPYPTVVTVTIAHQSASSNEVI